MTILECFASYLHDYSWLVLKIYRRAFHTCTIVVAWNIYKHVIATLSTCPGRVSYLLIEEGQSSQLDLQSLLPLHPRMLRKNKHKKLPK